ncbi:hypothetical protein [Burkholderia cepacia]|uniref:hypothetical protein n=1 Tax=Burkholderia cepacia TaxID=292 RepID=UPI000AAFC60D|nr:hypothetical protein [Burkholderia cepacia]
MNLADRDPVTLPGSVISDIREQGKTEITAAAGKAIAKTEGAGETAIANTA